MKECRGRGTMDPWRSWRRWIFLGSLELFASIVLLACVTYVVGRYEIEDLRRPTAIYFCRVGNSDIEAFVFEHSASWVRRYRVELRPIPSGIDYEWLVRGRDKAGMTNGENNWDIQQAARKALRIRDSKGVKIGRRIVMLDMMGPSIPIAWSAWTMEQVGKTVAIQIASGIQVDSRLDTATGIMEPVLVPVRICWGPMSAIISLLVCTILSANLIPVVMVRRLRRAHGRCIACGYSKAKNNEVCPECGYSSSES